MTERKLGHKLQVKVPKSIVLKARSIIKEVKLGSWPEDEWYSLSDSWDLNLWIDENDKKSAFIYRVFKGNTDTMTWKSLNYLSVMKGLRNERKISSNQ